MKKKLKRARNLLLTNKTTKIWAILAFSLLLLPVFATAILNINSNDIFVNYSNEPVAQTNTGSPTAYAILIGISDYPGTINDLTYAKKDMQDIRSLLVNEMGYSTENIFSFYDSAADSEEVLDKLDELKSVMTENDTLFFYYSGHGDYGYTNNGETAYNLESNHDYLPNQNLEWTIHVPNVDGIRVHFSKIEIEEDFDHLFIGDENLYVDLDDFENAVYDDYYTGECDGTGAYSWSYWIMSDTVHINLQTDESIQEWGFQIDKYETLTLNGSAKIVTYDGISENTLWGSTIDYYLDQINCKETYIVIDACHSGGIVNELNQTGRVIMSASELDRSSLEDSYRNQGLFTYYFLDAFERSSTTTGAYSSGADTNANGIITWDELYNYVKPEVVSRSASLGYVHEPQYVNNLTDSDSIMHPTIIEENCTTLNDGYFSCNFSVYGSSSLDSLTYQLRYTNGTIESFQVQNSETDYVFGTYEITSTPIGNVNVSDYVIITQYSNGMELYLFDSEDTTDSDSDGVPDDIEDILGTDDNDNDSDNDLLRDYAELCIYGTDPSEDDVDGDSLTDYQEMITYGTTPFDDDCDGDGLTDYYEVISYETDAYASDTDLDGYSDSEEVNAGSDPNDGSENPNNMNGGFPKYVFIIGGVIVGFFVLVIVIICIVSSRNRAKPNKFSSNQYQSGSYSYNPGVAGPISSNGSGGYINPYPSNDRRARTAMELYDKAMEAERMNNRNQAQNYCMQALQNGIPEPYNSEIRRRYGITPVSTNNPSQNLSYQNPSYQNTSYQNTSYQNNPTVSDTQNLSGQTHFCSNCGAKLPKNQRNGFCEHCGTHFYFN